MSMKPLRKGFKSTPVSRGTVERTMLNLIALGISGRAWDVRAARLNCQQQR